MQQTTGFNMVVATTTTKLVNLAKQGLELINESVEEKSVRVV